MVSDENKTNQKQPTSGQKHAENNMVVAQVLDEFADEVKSSDNNISLNYESNKYQSMENVSSSDKDGLLNAIKYFFNGYR